MATITKSIGTAGRDYSTITSWEAALAGAAGGAGNDAVGECYDDSAFDEAVTINDATPASITLTVAAGQRHDGTAGTGARIVRTAASSAVLSFAAASFARTVSWLSLAPAAGVAIIVGISRSSNNSGTLGIKNCLIFGMNKSVTNYSVAAMQLTGSEPAVVINTIVYSVTKSDSGSGIAAGIIAQGSAATSHIDNNTVYKVTSNSSTGAAALGYDYTDDADVKLKNNIGMATGGSTSGTKADFEIASPVNAVTGTNMSSDTSAPGTGSLISKSSANQFVSTAVGSEDLHLKSGADAIDAGTDLGTTPSGVQFDIDGYDRDAAGVVWDMGADEYVTTPPSGIPNRPALAQLRQQATGRTQHNNNGSRDAATGRQAYPS